MTEEGEILAVITSYLTLSLVLLFLPGAVLHISRQTREKLSEKDYKRQMK